MTEPVRRVAVTGAAGYIGRKLVSALEEDSTVESVLAIDLLPLAGHVSSKVAFLRHDITLPFAAALSDHRVDALVHLAFVLNPSRDRSRSREVNVGGALQALRSCTQAGVGHVVYLSSSTVYGAHPDNPAELTEESPMRPVSGFQYGEDKVEVEGLLGDLVKRDPRMTASVLRACPVMGPSADNFIATAFSKPFLVGVLGRDPEIQLCHEDDVIEVIRACTLSRSVGVYNVAGDRTIRWSEMVRAMGRRLVRLPAWIIYPLTELTWRIGLQKDSPAVGLDFIRYPWVVSTAKLRRELGFGPMRTSQEAWDSFARRTQPAGAGEVSQC